MNRRAALAGLLSLPLWAHAAARRPRVVYIASGVSEITRSWFPEVGLVDGRDFDLEVAPIDFRRPDAEATARALLATRPAVIVTPGWRPVFAFQKLGGDVPLVFVNFGGDPVRLGLVRSLREPGGRITGTAQHLMSMTPKLFETLRELKPGGRRGGVMIVQSSLAERHLDQGHAEIARAAEENHIEVMAVVVPDQPTIAQVREALDRSRVEYVFVTEDIYGSPAMTELIADLTQRRLPAIFIQEAMVDRGGLVAIAPDLQEGRHKAVEAVARILRGESPAKIPVYQSSRYHLSINRATARKMGVEIPGTLLTRADRIVD